MLTDWQKKALSVAIMFGLLVQAVRWSIDWTHHRRLVGIAQEKGALDQLNLDPIHSDTSNRYTGLNDSPNDDTNQQSADLHRRGRMNLAKTSAVKTQLNGKKLKKTAAKKKKPNLKKIPGKKDDEAEQKDLEAREIALNTSQEKLDRAPVRNELENNLLFSNNFAPATAPQPEEDAPGFGQTASDWQALVIDQPHNGNTSELVRLFLEKQIPAETFYEVVSQMLESPNEEVKLQGARALNSTPSVASFELKVATLQSTNYGSKVDTALRGGIERYSGKRQLKNLAQILKTSQNVEAVIIATQLLSDSANQILKRKPAQSDNDSQTPPNSQASQSAEKELEENKKTFAEFIPILDGLAGTSESGLQNLALDTKAQIEALLAPQAA